MKRILALSLALLMLLGLLAACSGTPAETEAPTEPVQTEPAEPAETETETETETELETETEKPEPTEEELARARFYARFWELDPKTTDEWFEANPDYLADGYDNVAINEAWLTDEGLDLYTTQGHQVLAIDAQEQILIVRIYCNKSRGVLAIAKDPGQLHLYPSSKLGRVGEHIDTIAKRHNGVLALTGSGFIDADGGGNGGKLAGFCRCDGVDYGKRYGYGYYRIEKHDDNMLYLTSAGYDVGAGTTDAMEFQPMLLKDGEYQKPGMWTGNNPRACLGQNDRGEILMSVVEGRFKDSPGCSVVEIAKVMKEYGGMNALNMDGGTTAIMWYRGQPITRCSNTSTPEGRYLPNAWVYVSRQD